MKKFCLLLFILLMKHVNAQQTDLISDIAASSMSSSPSSFAVMDGKLFFAASNWNGPTEDRELYISDGSAGGTSLFIDLLPGMSSEPDNMIVYDNHIYFTISDSSNGVLIHRPYVTDGTVSGTFPLLPNHTTTLGYSIEYDEFTSPDNIFIYYKGFVYFRGRKDNAANDYAIFKSDGTPAGTFIAADLPNSTLIPNMIEGPLVFNDSIYFTGTSNGSTQSNLYKSRGTVNSITLVRADITMLPEFGSIVYDNKLFFCGYESNGAELWLTDGTTSGTIELADLRTDSGLGSWPGCFNRLNDAIVFIANSTGNAVELYAIDSTATNLTPTVISTISYTPFIYRSDYLTRFSGKLFFCGHDFINGTELWSTNGTVSGTGMVVDVYPGQTGSDPDKLIRYCGKLYFSATNAINGFLNVLFESDGTPGGTVPVPGPVSNPNGCRNVFEKALFQGKLFYNGKYDGSIGNELYAYDSGCTVPVEEQTAGSSVKCYPNPGNQEIYISSSNEFISEIRILDLNGRLLKKCEYHTSGTITFHVPAIDPGVYLVSITRGNSVTFEKWIKQ